MLISICEKILGRLKDKELRVRAFAVQKGVEVLTPDSVSVSIDAGTFRMIAQKWYCEAVVTVLLGFKNLKDEEARRRGVYAIIMSAISMLQFQSLGLPIKELEPVRFRNVSTEGDDAESREVFGIEFRTHFAVPVLSEDEMADLLRVGLNYYLRPGDDAVDASDQVTMQGGN